MINVKLYISLLLLASFLPLIALLLRGLESMFVPNRCYVVVELLFGNFQGSWQQFANVRVLVLLGPVGCAEAIGIPDIRVAAFT